MTPEQENNHDQCLSTDDCQQEKKWREEFETLTVPNQSVYDNFKWFYFAARKAAQVEIDYLSEHRKNNCHWKKVAIKLADVTLKDRDQEIERLKETVNSCNERNRLLVEAGWKNILAKEQRDELIEYFLMATEHAIELGYLGEGSTLGMFKEGIEKARKMVGEK